jgi:C-terminal processing protease CtpA/Prc
VGDTIISVNGTSVVGKNLAGLADLLLGKPGTEVRTETKRGGMEL